MFFVGFFFSSFTTLSRLYILNILSFIVSAKLIIANRIHRTRVYNNINDFSLLEFSFLVRLLLFFSLIENIVFPHAVGIK